MLRSRALPSTYEWTPTAPLADPANRRASLKGITLMLLKKTVLHTDPTETALATTDRLNLILSGLR